MRLRAFDLSHFPITGSAPPSRAPAASASKPSAKLSPVIRASTGGRLIDEYEEIESGKRNDRPQIAAALAACRAKRAVLVIAKLDRLARNVAFISALRAESCKECT